MSSTSEANDTIVLPENEHIKVTSEAHQMFLKYHHKKESSGNLQGGATISVPTADDFPQFRKVQKTGVIYATSRASSYGFSPATANEWANMGQGAPETGPLMNSPSRNLKLDIPDDEIEYAPVSGDHDLRTSVARYYNHLYRKGHDSQYTADNVCIMPGGRAGITRIMSVLGHTQVGFFLPDYTAYEQLLGLFMRINPSPLVHRDVRAALMPPDEFKFQTNGRGIASVLMSNPCNPTGQSLEGDQLREYIEIARENNTTLIMDEFYSHYYYDGDGVDPADGGVDDDTNWPKTVSSSLYIDDVNRDPILIVNGLTKNWRCPGFRVCWVVGPAPIIDLLSSAGSFLDGGANAPLQKLALPLMDLDFIRRDAWALQRHFRQKRDYLLTELAKLGIKVQWKPIATFYIWGDLSDLPPPLNDCLVFLEEAVREKVICVPGVFFDVNPNDIRSIQTSNCISHVRFSYGPPMQNLTLGVKNIGQIIQRWTLHQEKHHRRATLEGKASKPLRLDLRQAALGASAPCLGASPKGDKASSPVKEV